MVDALSEFLDDAEHFELSDDSTVDTTAAVRVYHSMVAEIARLRAELAAVVFQRDASSGTLETQSRQIEELLADRNSLLAELAAALLDADVFVQSNGALTSELLAARQGAERLKERLVKYEPI